MDSREMEHLLLTMRSRIISQQSEIQSLDAQINSTHEHLRQDEENLSHVRSQLLPLRDALSRLISLDVPSRSVAMQEFLHHGLDGLDAHVLVLRNALLDLVPELSSNSSIPP